MTISRAVQPQLLKQSWQIDNLDPALVQIDFGHQLLDKRNEERFSPLGIGRFDFQYVAAREYDITNGANILTVGFEGFHANQISNPPLVCLQLTRFLPEAENICANQLFSRISIADSLEIEQKNLSLRSQSGHGVLALLTVMRQSHFLERGEEVQMRFGTLYLECALDSVRIYDPTDEQPFIHELCL